MSERVLIYGGLTVSKSEILKLVPGAIVRGPAAQSDILSDVVRLDPTHLILIDGKFHQSLPVWHKELVYALLHPSLEGRVYGAASMGALRAADLSMVGMIGYGEVFRWYDEGLLSDDSEVAVAFHLGSDSNPVQDTVALVDIRATIAREAEEYRKDLFLAAKHVHWSDRTLTRIHSAWHDAGVGDDEFPEIVPQKRIDAIGLLNEFRSLPVPGPKGISHESLTELFKAQFERERKVTVGEKEIALEDIDAHLALTNPYGRRIFEDASNRAIAIMMCDQLLIGASDEEKIYEMAEFCLLNGIQIGAVSEWRERNGLSAFEFDLLMWNRARIKKLHRMLKTSRAYRKCTYDVMTYLWNCDRAESIIRSAIEVPHSGDYREEEPVGERLESHCGKNKIPLAGDPGQFALDLGFGSVGDLNVALSRYCQEE